MRKACAKCGEQKLLTEFYPNKKRVRSACKACCAKYARERVGQPPTSQPRTCIKCNKLKPAEQFDVSRRYAGGRVRECKVCRAARVKSHWPGYYQSRRAELLEAACLHWRANREAVNATRRIRHAKCPAKRRNENHKRRSRIGGAAGFTPHEWKALVERFGGCCAYCLRQSESLTVDHLDPISRGGAHELTNIVPACLSCNVSKGDRSLLSVLTNPRLLVAQRMVK